MTIAAVLLGVIFRAGQFLSRQSFRADEVGLLINIVDKPTNELFTAHLEHGQAAPPLFLALQRSLALAIGTDELTQRLVPFLLSVLVLPLFALLAWRTLDVPAAVVVTAMLCFSDKAIWFSAEVKQYSGDVFVTVVLMLLFLHAVRAGPVGWMSVLASFGAAIIWFSHAAILVFAGLSGSLFVLLWMKRRHRAALLWVAINLLFAASFAVLYFISIRHQSADSYLQEWWGDSYVNWQHPWRAPLWLITRMHDLVSYPISPFEWLGIVLIPLILLGTFYWAANRRWDLLAICLAPMFANVIAAAVHKYPFSGSRVNMFLVPGLLLLGGAGIEVLAAQYRTGGASLPPSRGSPRVPPSLIAAIAIALLAFPLAECVRCMFLPRNKGQMRQAVAYLKQHRAPGEPVYVLRNGSEFQWYWPDAPGPLHLNESVPTNDPPLRFWVVFSYNAEPHGQRDLAGHLAPARSIARETGQRLLVRGAACCEFERTTPVKDSL